MTQYMLEEQKFEGKKIYVLYERQKGTVDIPIYDTPRKVNAIKYKKYLEARPGVEKS